jgi:hypothetical protein
VTARLELTRAQILGFRRRAGHLDERLPPGPESLRRAAWAGLQDSMPRAALLSIHARVAGTGPSAWEDPALAQVWGPRLSVYVVPACDRAVFTLGTLPDDAAARQKVHDRAAGLAGVLGSGRMSANEAGRLLGVHPNHFRFAAAAGTIAMRWDGARRPEVWMVPAPEADPRDARLELARRYLHVYGPATPESFGGWAGLGRPPGIAAFEALGAELTPVTMPTGDAWALAADEAALRAGVAPVGPARLIPSGDAYVLLQGTARELLVPDAARRALLWTPRVWPGAILVNGEIAGTWRRAGRVLTATPWQPLSPAERDAVTAEAESLPLPDGRVVVRWDD